MLSVETLANIALTFSTVQFFTMVCSYRWPLRTSAEASAAMLLDGFEEDSKWLKGFLDLDLSIVLQSCE